MVAQGVSVARTRKAHAGKRAHAQACEAQSWLTHHRLRPLLARGFCRLPKLLVALFVAGACHGITNRSRRGARGSCGTVQRKTFAAMLLTWRLSSQICTSFALHVIPKLIYPSSRGAAHARLAARAETSAGGIAVLVLTDYVALKHPHALRSDSQRATRLGASCAARLPRLTLCTCAGCVPRASRVGSALLISAPATPSRHARRLAARLPPRRWRLLQPVGLARRDPPVSSARAYLAAPQR